jgi:5'(3')-deoxyribonucleotidase
MKTIAIDLDDTLNDFSETLRDCVFVRDQTHPISEAVFDDYLAKVRGGAATEGDLLSTEYSFFRYRIHQQCYERARARADGVAFMRWLRRENWRIVICTQRDLRRAQDATRKWLTDNEIPFDYLFTAGNKIVFCKVWGIEHLVDDHPFNIAHGPRFGVNVYFPAKQPSQAFAASTDAAACPARPFSSFEEIKPWIQS